MTQTLQYTDRHCLSFADDGDPNGYPILIQHGLIASIVDVGLFSSLLEAGMRLISIARPGYGESTPYAMKNMAEWGDIVSFLVDQLHLSEFDVLGMSSGAPYSYAIGYRLPAKVRSIYIFSGTPALYDDAILVHWPYAVNKQASLLDLQRLARTLFFADLSDSDRQRNDIKDSTMNDCFGIAQDLKLRCQDWGFRLADVSAFVYMQHSKEDAQVPFVTAQMTAERLPNCQFEIREKGEHFSTDTLDTFIRTAIVDRHRRAIS